MNYQNKTDSLFNEQKTNWPLLADNLKGLKNAQLKTLRFNGFSINIQYNPKRITSSAAKVDAKSIKKRKCFLCSANRPPEQNQVMFENDFEILCNPFPIFNQHYTIATLKHKPQQIKTSFKSFLNISKSLPKLVTFYNAPNCGASAPDHLHFQAGNRGFIPIENEIENLKSLYGKTIPSSNNIHITYIDDSLRRFIVLESQNREAINEVFDMIYEYTSGLVKGNEPMLNILSWYYKKWYVVVFPRSKHRPWQFFENGNKNILLSPASIDFGGTLITPLKKDFDKITRNDIIDIFNQVSMQTETFNNLTDFLKNELNAL